MLIVRGTKKFRDRVRGPAIGVDVVAGSTLGEWFATALFWRPHAALLVNERTLVPVVMPLAPAASALDRIPAAIEAVLRAHGVRDEFVAAEVAAMAEVRLGPTNNRSVLGVMNEFTELGTAYWQRGLRDYVELSLELSRVPLGPLRAREGAPDLELAAHAGSSTPRATRRHLRVVPPPAPTGTVFQLKATILETSPPVWRRVLVPADVTLDGLHEIVQAAFGWWNYHLHEFEIGRSRYGVPDPDDDWDPPLDERDVRLDSVATEGSRFRYTYDFGDDWGHQIVVEKVFPADPTLQVPACVDGRRACPPEDCGGPWGYQELLTILGDPDHPERSARLEWIGGAFDPDAFDPSEFGDALRLGGSARFRSR